MRGLILCILGGAAAAFLREGLAYIAERKRDRTARPDWFLIVWAMGVGAVGSLPVAGVNAVIP